MDIKENAAYLKGLFDGLDIEKDSKEGKVMGQMLDLMMKMSERITELEDLYDDLHEYVEEQRIKKAIDLMLSTNMTLTQIAYECGFSSQSYFSYAFKHAKGMSPRTYAKKLIGKYDEA